MSCPLLAKMLKSRADDSLSISTRICSFHLLFRLPKMNLTLVLSSPEPCLPLQTSPFAQVLLINILRSNELSVLKMPTNTPAGGRSSDSSEEGERRGEGRRG